MTRYEVLERIGAGRMAEMFRGKAIAAGGFEKPVAIKRILPHLSSDPRFVELLIAEAKILSVLRHRNVVQIFDVGVGDDGHHFLVMEFVDGIDLGALQRHLEANRQRLPIDLVLHAGAEVCEALEYAQHGAGPDGKPMRLVHRDVTPGNVLVSRSGEIKLTDFGLAKRPEDGTSAGGLRGRFGYVSPEQASGMPVDGRADVFAVGVMIWELALGRRLFSGLADFDALRAVRETTIPRVRDHDPSLPADLDAILVEALAKDPAARLPNAGELGKRLRGLRYSLDDSSGDPAAALARLVAGVERGPPAAAVEPPTATRPAKKSPRPSPGGFDGAEPTVLRIRTADGFADDVEGTSLVAARRVLDSFEEEQTRMSRLPSRAFEEVSTTGGRPYFDSGEMPSQAPLHLSRESAEITAATPPIDHDEAPRETRRPARASRAPAPPPVPEPRPTHRGAAVAPPGPPPRPPTNVPIASSSSLPKAPASSASLPKAPASSASLPKAPSSSPSLPPMQAPPSSPSMSRSPPVPLPASSPSMAMPPAAYPVMPGPRAGTAHPVAGFGHRRRERRWLPIAIAAVAIAALSFLITRAALDPSDPVTTGGTPADAGPAPDAAPLAAIDAGTPDAPLDAAIDATSADDGGAPDDALAATAVDDGGTPGDGGALDDATPAGDASVPEDAATADAAAPPADRIAPSPPRRRPPARKPPRKKKKRAR